MSRSRFLPISLLLCSLASLLGLPAFGSAAERPAPPPRVLASVLGGSSPAALAVVDVAADPADANTRQVVQRVVHLPSAARERALCQAVSTDGTRTSIWVATESRLFRVDGPDWKVGANLPLAAEAVGSTVDLVAWHQPEGDRVALALSPDPGGPPPSVVVVDGATGELVSRYTASSASMTAVHALHKDGDLFALYNQRNGGGAYAAITGLLWDGTGFSETRSMFIPGPEPVRGDAAFSGIGPGRAAAISRSGEFVVLVDLFGPGTLEPFPELEWGTSAVAAAGDVDELDETSEAPVFVVDRATGSLLHRSPEDPHGELRRLDLAAAGAPPSLGTNVVVSGAAACGALTSPEAGTILLFDTVRLTSRGLLRIPIARPTSILLLP